MRKLAVLAGLGGVLLLALGSYALAGGGSNNARGGKLVGYQEAVGLDRRVGHIRGEARRQLDRVQAQLQESRG